MRAAVVQLDAVGPGVGGALDELVPLLAGLDHERGDDGVVRPALLDLGDFLEINLGRAVGDELDVVEAEHAVLAVVQRGVARRDVDDGHADGFPDDAAPAGLEGAVRLVAGVGRRTGGDPERIGGLDAGEITAQISHKEGELFLRG